VSGASGVRPPREIRRVIVVGILTLAGMVAVIFTWNFDPWGQKHVTTLRAEREQTRAEQERWQIGEGMTEADVRGRLGEPVEVDAPPFPENAPARTRRRIRYRKPNNEFLSVFLDENGVVIGTGSSMSFDPVEF
jgi:hypothetical protein